MTLDDLVVNCPTDPVLRATIQSVLDADKQRGGPMIVRYYRFNEATMMLHTDEVNTESISYSIGIGPIHDEIVH
jgi:hypothetical protein